MRYKIVCFFWCFPTNLIRLKHMYNYHESFGVFLTAKLKENILYFVSNILYTSYFIKHFRCYGHCSHIVPCTKFERRARWRWPVAQPANKWWAGRFQARLIVLLRPWLDSVVGGHSAVLDDGGGGGLVIPALRFTRGRDGAAAAASIAAAAAATELKMFIAI